MWFYHIWMLPNFALLDIVKNGGFGNLEGLCCRSNSASLSERHSYNLVYVNFFLYMANISLTQSNIQESTSIFIEFIWAFPHLANAVSAYIESVCNCLYCATFKFPFLIMFKQGFENSLALIICQLLSWTWTFVLVNFTIFALFYVCIYNSKKFCLEFKI